MASIRELRSIEQPQPLPQPDSVAPDKLYHNYRALIERAVSVFGDEITASRWLSAPNPDTGGMAPLDLARKARYEPDTLEPIFVQIEHGIDF